jgi:predicted lysophospholipase L1 biosynthesis ABC-type transport system permease subunit
MDQAQYKAQYAKQVNQLLNLVYGLLALAVIIALIGIANTLVLSVYERTRELGLLRAVGTTRGQLRSIVRLESLVISLLGAIEGLVLGILFGWAIVAAMHAQGVSHLVFPVAQLVVGRAPPGGARVRTAWRSGARGCPLAQRASGIFPRRALAGLSEEPVELGPGHSMTYPCDVPHICDAPEQGPR